VPRKLIWVADSLDRLAAFPPAVRNELGFALYQAQVGQQHTSAKVLRGFTETVWQVRADDPGGTYRAVYVTQLGDAVYALCFPEEGGIRNRNSPSTTGFNPATAPGRSETGWTIGNKMPNREYTLSSGNVFADLNLPHADDLLAKAELAAKIVAEIKRRRLTQTRAAAVLGIDQPKVSALKQGKLSGFSIERLMRLILRLGRDVEIRVTAKPRSGSAARLRVA
jgi:predicted XRE-type DNA-binding protein